MYIDLMARSENDYYILCTAYPWLVILRVIGEDGGG